MKTTANHATLLFSARRRSQIMHISEALLIMQHSLDFINRICGLYQTIDYNGIIWNLIGFVLLISAEDVVIPPDHKFFFSYPHIFVRNFSEVTSAKFTLHQHLGCRMISIQPNKVIQHAHYLGLCR
jgi:hypothetical protein